MKSTQRIRYNLPFPFIMLKQIMSRFIYIFFMNSVNIKSSPLLLPRIHLHSKDVNRLHRFKVMVVCHYSMYTYKIMGFVDDSFNRFINMIFCDIFSPTLGFLQVYRCLPFVSLCFLTHCLFFLVFYIIFMSERTIGSWQTEPRE